MRLESLEHEPEAELWREHAERVLRQVVKTGAGSARLVDARTLLLALGDDIANRNSHRNASPPPTTTTASTIPESVRSLRQAGRVLSRDAETGGRFKRWPCVFVSSGPAAAAASTHASRGEETEESAGGRSNGAARTVCFLNGGWLVVDQSVRAGTEARKFVDRGAAMAAPAGAADAGARTLSPLAFPNHHETSQSRRLGATASPLSADDPRSAPAAFRTQADRRIIQRLECLALGQGLLQLQRQQPAAAADRLLEVDVREALVAMGLPLTPQGAKEALLRVGYWTREVGAEHARVQPWSQPVVSTANFVLVECLVCSSRLLNPSASS
jgi:hypothetical protein